MKSFVILIAALIGTSSAYGQVDKYINDPTVLAGIVKTCTTFMDQGKAASAELRIDDLGDFKDCLSSQGESTMGIVLLNMHHHDASNSVATISNYLFHKYGYTRYRAYSPQQWEEAYQATREK